MKVVILAGGLGTRLAEETEVKPKPMVEIGGHPILWHIMKLYGHYKYRSFYLALGYKGEVIKRYFRDYLEFSNSLRINLATREVKDLEYSAEDWEVNLVDTGHDTLTGGRVKRLEPWLKGSTFLVTYGDGVANVNIKELIEFHRAQGKIATITAVRPPARFGGIIFEGNLVGSFTEKPQIGEGWINGGFMVCESAIFKYLEGDYSSLEGHALERLAEERQLAAYKHDGFWQCMDTLRDKRLLESLWQSGQAPWKVWEK
ncbi:MAG TPA: glucose-1-phosphate cytidylyltransferase [Oligoflexia bacterium]|mgnify:CR=1 FL=1|nr:glucose-1-phosphate cytidylyltransferase [Oligoflexia bacterium]